MADKARFKVVKKWIPNLKRYRYNIVHQHVLLYGRGTAVLALKTTRMKVLPEKLDHFLKFITSQYIIQDLPFGVKTLKLSSNTEIKVPDVVRTLISEQIVQQYLCYCDVTDFAPMSRFTQCRILKVCSASVRNRGRKKNELAVIIDEQGDNYGKGHSWAKEQPAKRYFKCNYKVVHVSPASRVPDHCRAFVLSYPGDPDTVVIAIMMITSHRCELFPDVVHEIESVLEEVQSTKEEKDEMKYKVSQAKK
ncbi:unnamed protein product, partial [Pocillopora meandrina]